MIRAAFCLLLALCSLADARENPFFPAEGIKDLPMTTNLPQEITPLKRAAMTLPDSARVLKSVTVTYQNLDGSVETKEVPVNQGIDWHLPLFISQSYQAKEQAVEAAPATAAAPSAPQRVTVYDFGFLRMEKEGNIIKLISTRPYKRHFTMTNPHRVVVDFSSEKSVKGQSRKISFRPYTKLRIGNHDDYFRVVLELDGMYRLHVKKTADGVSVTYR